jgi:hypothetical protein
MGTHRTEEGPVNDRTAFAIAVGLTLLIATFVFGAGGLAHGILP